MRGKRLQQKKLKKLYTASDQKSNLRQSWSHLKFPKENIFSVGVKRPGGLAYRKEWHNSHNHEQKQLKCKK
jgi:hypothetical protein